MTKRFGGLAVGVLIVAAAAFTFGVLWMRSAHGEGPVPYDIYGFFYPNQVYAWRSIRNFSGLLWNPYQDCGQPFFALSQVGVLYPVNLVFAALDREPALLTSALINLSISGVGAFLLASALGLGPVPALCAALSFELGWVAAWLASWSPIHIASLAWLPVALWRTERLLQRPTVRRVIALGVVLTIQDLPGFFQIGFFTYQLIALRVLWACVTSRAAPRLRLLGFTAAGLALPVLLGAVQLFPSIEVARESLRGFNLPPDILGPAFSWTRLAGQLTSSFVFSGYAIVALLALASLLPIGSPAMDGAADIRPAGATADRWNGIAFYWLIALGYFALSVGPGSLLYDVYERLPLGRAFRDPSRLAWVTNFALAMLAGWGAEALLSPARGAERMRRVGALLGVLLLLGLLGWHNLQANDLLLGGGTVLAAALAGAPRWRPGASLLLPVLIALGCIVFGRPPVPLFGLLRGDIYSTHAALFASVRERLTPQDRVFIAGRNPDFSLMPKSASLFQLPNVFDYETQAPRLYVDYFTYMRTGRRLQSIRDWYWIFGKLLTPTMQRRLFDATAARYLLVDPRLPVEQSLRGGIRLVSDGDVRVYENLQALPRARYVARAIVAADDDALAQLAASPLDPREVAWVSEAPRSGFLHGGDGAAGSAEIVTDLPERVVVRVRATQPGFLFLADQYYPGWTVEVNGAAAELLRANHAFRLVEVPAGESTVVFAYRPLSVRLGAAVSLLTAIAIAVVWYRDGAAR